ncbi:MAG: hypothetical protein AABY76_04225, partial [Planctomycetota bacterium]
SSVRNEILVENNRRNNISSIGTIYLIVEQLGFNYIMPTAFYVYMRGLLFAALNAIINNHGNFTLFMRFCRQV